MIFYPMLYSIAAILFVLYSYTQVDLSLTLTRAGFLQGIQHAFQQVGYFNRPVSTGIFVGILLLLFILYGYTVFRAYNNTISRNEFWMIVIVISVITLFAYPAFSYDFFNYLFTAKTVLVYHKNPYLVIPLQFAGIDPWLSFMHWTHLPSAYTPLWIISTMLPYIFGFGYLIVLIWNLKLYLTIAYIATVYGIGKIVEVNSPKLSIVGMVIFALNPLVIVECLISPHNDIVMMALAIWSIVLYEKRSIWWSWSILSVSIAMKLMTIFLIPAFLYKWNRKFTLLCMVLGLSAVLTQREVLSWYWIWILPFIALLPENRSVTFVSAGISLGLMLRYVPFLYFGHWNPPVDEIKTYVTITPILAALLWLFVSQILLKKNTTIKHIFK